MPERNQKMELFYEVNKWYSITINPNDSYQRYGKGIDRLKSINQIFFEHLLGYSQSKIQYKLHYDISEPRDMVDGKSPRVHFHGVIRFTTPMSIRNWLLYHSHQLSKMSYVNIDTIDDPNKWIGYCKKYDNITLMSPLTNHRGLFMEMLKDYSNEQNNPPKIMTPQGVAE